MNDPSLPSRPRYPSLFKPPPILILVSVVRLPNLHQANIVEVTINCNSKFIHCISGDDLLIDRECTIIG